MDGKGPSVRKFLRRRKSWNGQTFVCCVHGAIVWFCGVRYENADESSSMRESYLPPIWTWQPKCWMSRHFFILNTINPSNTVALDLSRVLLIIVDEIHTMTSTPQKECKRRFVRANFGSGGNERISWQTLHSVYWRCKPAPFRCKKRHHVSCRAIQKIHEWKANVWKKQKARDKQWVFEDDVFLYPRTNEQIDDGKAFVPKRGDEKLFTFSWCNNLEMLMLRGWSAFWVRERWANDGGLRGAQ